MNDETSILIVTKNNQDTIRKMIIDLNKYQKKYRNIKTIIISDQNSKDETIKEILEAIKELKNPSINLITNPKYPLKAYETGMQQIITKNTITLPPFPETNFRMIQKEIKMLRKSSLIMPNRFHQNTLNKLGKNKEIDHSNPNKAYKTKIIKELLKKNPFLKYKELNIRTTICPTNLKKN